MEAQPVTVPFHRTDHAPEVYLLNVMKGTAEFA